MKILRRVLDSVGKTSIPKEKLEMPVVGDEKLLDREEFLARMRQRQEETGQVILPGCIYTTSEPEFVGCMPVRTEIEVLPADDANQLKIGWTTTCYSGDEVTQIGSTEPITKRSGLHPGMTVMAWGMSWTVVRDGLFSLALERENSIGTIEFNKDDRKCWACPAIINKKVLESPNKSLFSQVIDFVFAPFGARRR
jgi:hypothetical protein